MKTTATKRVTKSAKAGHRTIPPNATGVAFPPDDFKTLRQCADTCGQTVEAFVRSLILSGLERLDGLDPLAMPCPFCRNTDQLEIVTWSQERRDGTEYMGPAMRCHRCECVVTMAAWMMRGLRG